MTITKKYVSIALILILLVTLTACNGKQRNNTVSAEDGVHKINGNNDTEKTKTHSDETNDALPEAGEDFDVQSAQRLIEGNEVSFDDTKEPEDENSQKEELTNEGLLSDNESSNTMSDNSNSKNDEDKGSSSEIINEIEEGIIEITREEAGLSTIPSLDFDGFVLNSSLLRILEKPTTYTNEDYKNGLICEQFIIVSERFKDSIIEDIKIGEDISRVIDILGEPSSLVGNTLFYKTKDYYLGFKGNEKIQQAILSQKPHKYPKYILKTITDNINLLDFSGIPTLLSQNSEISEFFDHDGHIHGGGWYAFAMNGICLKEFTENSVMVYNNFEGDLYKLQGEEYKYGIIYNDIDYMMDSMVSALNSHIRTNVKFEENGLVSPGRVYNSVYVWNYSESYYFIIRSMENNHPDKYIGLPATGDYYWLNNSYILYSDFFSYAPYLLNVNTEQIVNVLAETELYDVDDYGFYSFEIKSYEDGFIEIYHEEESKEYRIGYFFDEDGKIQLVPESIHSAN